MYQIDLQANAKGKARIKTELQRHPPEIFGTSLLQASIILRTKSPKLGENPETNNYVDEFQHLSLRTCEAGIYHAYMYTKWRAKCEFQHIRIYIYLVA